MLLRAPSAAVNWVLDIHSDFRGELDRVSGVVDLEPARLRRGCTGLRAEERALPGLVPATPTATALTRPELISEDVRGRLERGFLPERTWKT